jgi:hypothetical protein
MKRVTLVRLPGVLADASDASGAIAALGGEDALRAVTYLEGNQDKKASLTLTLRPGELSTRSNIGSVVSVPPTKEDRCLFVLHVTSVRDGAAGERTPGTSILQAVVESRVARLFSFPGIADFQLFSRYAIADVAPSIQRGKSEVTSPWVHGSANVRPLGTKAVPPVGSVPRTGSNERAPWREKSFAEGLAEAAWEFSRNTRNEYDDAAEAVRESTERVQWLSDMRPSRWARSVTDEGAIEHWFKDFAMCTPEGTSRNVATGDAHACTAGEWQRWTEENAKVLRAAETTLVKVDKRESSKRLTNLAYRVDLTASKVPDKSPIAEPTYENLREAIADLRTRFAARPVWSRRKLLSTACTNTRKHFKNAVPHVAFAFTALTGPFHSLWIRYGYDPRSNAALNLMYQSIELRLPDAKSAAAIEKKFGKNSRDDTNDAGNYSLVELPSKRQILLQLCDIVAPGLEELLASPANLRSEFSVTTGYLSAEGLQAVLSHLRSRVQQLVISTLGEDQFRSLTEKQLDRRKILNKNRTSANWSSISEGTQNTLGGDTVSAGVQVLSMDDDAKATELAAELAEELQAAGIDTVVDDAAEESPKVAKSGADNLIGAPEMLSPEQEVVAANSVVGGQKLQQHQESIDVKANADQDIDVDLLVEAIQPPSGASAGMEYRNSGSSPALETSPAAQDIESLEDIEIYDDMDDDPNTSGGGDDDDDDD